MRPDTYSVRRTRTYTYTYTYTDTYTYAYTEHLHGYTWDIDTVCTPDTDASLNAETAPLDSASTWNQRSYEHACTAFPLRDDIGQNAAAGEEAPRKAVVPFRLNSSRNLGY